MKLKKTIPRLLFLFTLFFLCTQLSSCAVLGGGKQRDSVDFTRLRDTRPDFVLQKSIPPLVREYLDYYKLPVLPDRYYFGYINSGEWACPVHLFLPSAEPKGTVFIIHGFLSHFGFFQDLVPYLLTEGWAVAGIDLPGHGLATGEPTAINNFSDYGNAVKELTRTVLPLAPGPFAVIGHSMGCASLLEYARTTTSEFAGYVFIAPLLHSRLYALSRAGFYLARPFIDSIPRSYEKTTSNREYLDFKEFHDPLQTDRISPSWAEALYRWNTDINGKPLPDIPVYIIQGTLDRVVDYRYNIKYFQEYLPLQGVEFIEGARHELLKEIPEYRDILFKSVSARLNEISTSQKD